MNSIVIDPLHWLIFGTVLIISEIFLMTFASLWFGIAALIVAFILWLIPISFVAQMTIWLFLSIFMVFAWFKYMKPLSTDHTKAGLGGNVIVGEVGMIVIKPLPNHLGTVRFSVPVVGSTEWMCRTLGEEVEVGQRVVVTNIVGNELIVSPMQQLR